MRLLYRERGMPSLEQKQCRGKTHDPHWRSQIGALPAEEWRWRQSCHGGKTLNTAEKKSKEVFLRSGGAAPPRQAWGLRGRSP